MKNTIRFLLVLALTLVALECDRTPDPPYDPTFGKHVPTVAAPVVVTSLVDSGPPLYRAHPLALRNTRTEEQQIRDACQPTAAERAAGKVWGCPAIDPHTLKLNPKYLVMQEVQVRP